MLVVTAEEEEEEAEINFHLPFLSIQKKKNMGTTEKKTLFSLSRADSPRIHGFFELEKITHPDVQPVPPHFFPQQSMFVKSNV